MNIEGNKKMKFGEAYKIIKHQYPNEELIECLEFDDFFAFAFTEKEKLLESVGGGYDTVDKVTGAISVFNPIDDFDNYFNRIIDETDEDYLYPPEFFVEKHEDGYRDWSPSEYIIEHLAVERK